MWNRLVSRRGVLALAGATAALALWRVKPAAARSVSREAPRRARAALTPELAPWRADAAARFARHSALRSPAG